MQGRVAICSQSKPALWQYKFPVLLFSEHAFGGQIAEEDREPTLERTETEEVEIADDERLDDDDVELILELTTLFGNDLAALPPPPPFPPPFVPAVLVPLCVVNPGAALFVAA